MVPTAAAAVSATPTTVDADVLIVGCGPAGLVTALELHLRGLRVLLIDRQLAAYPLPRAVCLDHESYRILMVNGLEQRTQDIFRYGEDNRHEGFSTFAWRDKDFKILVAMDWDKPGSSTYPQVIGFSQPQLEARIQDEVLAQGIEMRRGVELVGLEQNDAGVTCTLAPSKKAGSTDSATSSLRVRYVIGADGSNSIVRQLAGITMTSLPFSEDWLVLDLLPVVPGVWPIETTAYGPMQLCDPDQPTTLAASGPGRKRLEFMRMPGQSREDLLKPETIWRLCRRWGFTPDNCVWERATIYTFLARWADTWNQGRVLLAGDAAHNTPPFIGQGMNSGLRDAANLGWRLPLVIRGHASSELLDGYTAERRPHMQYVTEVAIRLGQVICLTDKVKAAAAHAELAKNATEPHPEPGLGRPGTFIAESVQAGQLAFQDQVRVGDRVGLAESVLSRGWLMFSTTCDPADRLSPTARRHWAEQLGGRSLHVTAESDVNGTYTRWLQQHDVDLLVIRPDFYIAATARTVDEADAVVLQLAKLAHLL